VSSRVEVLEAQLAVAKAEEAYLNAKAKRVAGDLSDKQWAKAKRTVSAARIKQRVTEGRKGSEQYRIEDDGTVVHMKERTRKVFHRNDKDEIIPEKTEYITEVVEEVVG
jgi:hypothetical protein